MLGDSGLLPLNLPTLLKLAITALAFVPVLLFLFKWAASHFFMVDARFESDVGGFEVREKMPDCKYKCSVCENQGTMRCSRCKSARYCSQKCQIRHWKNGHRQSCKDPKDLNHSLCNGNISTEKNSSIALVPSQGSCKILGPDRKVLFSYDEFVKLFKWNKLVFPPCGLLNCGNSCFANVILQCLACTRPLVAYMLEGNHSMACIRNDWCFLCELQSHVQKVSQSSSPFSPTNILCRLPKIGGNLGQGRQEDAHEFMRFAIDTMQSVCLDEFGGEKVLDHNVQESTLIQHIFGGHLQSQVKCTKCEKMSNRYENMMDLTVEIHGDAESLEECLNQFTGKEWLDGENMYKCEGCDQYVKAWKRLTVQRPPNVLTIALKRFQSGRFGKLNKRVTFPATLDLNPYTSKGEGSEDIYDLYAVVVHIDMLNASFFGHYICYTRDFSGHWYLVDDCKVASVDVHEVLAQAAYMLLYIRRSVRSAPLKDPDVSKSRDEESTKLVSNELENEAVVVETESSGPAEEENPLKKIERDISWFLKEDSVSEGDSSSTISEETVDQSRTDSLLSVCNAEVNPDSSHCLHVNGVDHAQEDSIASNPCDEIEESVSAENGEVPESKDKDSSLDNGLENLRIKTPKPLFPRGFLDRGSIPFSRKILETADLPQPCYGR